MVTQEELRKQREDAVLMYKDWDYTGEERMIPVRDGEVRVRIYRPELQCGALPVFFDVHGGGWAVHTCEVDQPFCEKIKEQLGIVVVSVDYRLTPEYKWPVPNYDVYDVIKHFYCNAALYQIDPQRMGVGGHSAGGQISLAVAMMAKESGDFRLRCTILDYPGLDLATPWKDKAKEPVTDFQREFIELCDFFDRCNYCTEEEKKHYLRSPWYATREQLEGLPPTMLTACENDLLKYENTAFSAKLMEAGVEVTGILFRGVIHGFNADQYYTQEADESHRKMISFLRQHLFAD